MLTHLLLTLAATSATTPSDSNVPVETLLLDNGMKFLLVPRPELSTISAGWVAHVGSANERPGITGLSHLFEHMLFKGTHTIGTTDIERDLEIIAEPEKSIRAIYREQRRRYRLGEIDDPFATENRSDELIALEARFRELVEEQRTIMVKDEFDLIYTGAGGTGMNAGTTNDFTIYFITVPANKLELWCWMESDRLVNPVMREFYAERDVVHEERRLRTESTPTGKFNEQFDAMFWESHPYSWPVIGWPSDLRVITKEQADEYFATYYAPNNLTGALVGNFELAEARELIEQYFGRLPKRDTPAPDVVTLEMEQLAEKRMEAECDCQPQTEVRYHTVPFMHRDSYALDVLAGLLNGRTGRLYKKLIEELEIASSARCGQNSSKYAGSFSFSAETKGDATPGDLEQAWYDVLQTVIDGEIPERELQKVKNGIAADAYRQLESPFSLLLQLLFYDTLGDWRYINEWSERSLAVTAEDVKRVAREYLTANNRAVAHYRRKEGSAAEAWPAEVLALPAEMQGPVKGQLRQFAQIEDPERVREILNQLSQAKASVPEEQKPALVAMEAYLQQHLASLSADEATTSEGNAE